MVKLKRTGIGAIAQLGERLLCTQEVSGSIPLSSTIYTVVMVEATEDGLSIGTG